MSDLIIEDVEVGGAIISPNSVVPGTYAIGSQFSVTYDVRNLGTTSAGSSSAAIYMTINGVLTRLDTNATTALAAGAQDTNETLSFTLPGSLSPGTYAVAILADYNGTVSETNESNNAFAFIINVVAPQLPDLVIEDVVVGGQALSQGELVTGNFAPGETFSVTCDVRNQGAGDARSSTAAIYLVINGVATRMDTNLTASLAAGSQDTNETLSFTVPADLAPGTYGVIIAVDDDNIIAESGGSNNTFGFILNIVHEIDSVREGTDTEETLTVGGTINGVIDQNGIDGANTAIDKDWYAVDLFAGRTYSFSGTSTVNSGDTLDAIAMRVYRSNTTTLTTLYDSISPNFYFTPATSGTYYLAVSAGGAGVWQDKIGAFSVSVEDSTSVSTIDTVREGTDTEEVLMVGKTANGTINQNGKDGANAEIDRDWFQIDLVAGHTYIFSGTSTTSSTDTLNAIAMRMYQNNTTMVSQLYDAVSPNFNFTPTTSGTYYLAVSAGGSGVWQDKTGAFNVSVEEFQATSYYAALESIFGDGRPLDFSNLAEFFSEAGRISAKIISGEEYRRAMSTPNDSPIKVYNPITDQYAILRLSDPVLERLRLEGVDKASIYAKWENAFKFGGLIGDAAQISIAANNLLNPLSANPIGFDQFMDRVAAILAGSEAGAAAAGFTVAVGAIVGAPITVVVISAAIASAYVGCVVEDAVEDQHVFSSILRTVLATGYVRYDDPAYAPFVTANSTAPVIVTNSAAETHTVSSSKPIVWGIAPNLAGDSLLDFSTGDAFVVANSTIPRADLSIESGSAIIRMPDGATGAYLDPITLSGDFSGGEFMAVTVNSNTIVRFVEFLPNLREGALVSNPNVLGIQNSEFFQGNGERSFAVRVVDLPNATVDPTDAFGVFWIDALGNISNVQFIDPGIGTNAVAPLVLGAVPQGVTLGLFVADGGAALAQTLTSVDTLRLISHPNKTSDGLWLEINGAFQSINILNSVSRLLNSDGLEHVVSGAINGGTGMLVGFEDALGSSVGDFVDLVIEITQIGSRPKYDLQLSGAGTSIDTFQRGQSGQSLVGAYNGGLAEFKGPIRYLAFLSTDQFYSENDVVIADFMMENEFARNGELTTTALYGYTIPASISVGDYYFGNVVLSGSDANTNNDVSWLGNNREDDMFSVTFATGPIQPSEVSIASSDVNWVLVAAPDGSTLRGNNLDNRIQGAASADIAYGGSGHDRMFGAGGNDTLLGEDGNDSIAGDIGNDVLSGGPASAGQFNTLDGGEGNDTASYQGLAAHVYVDLNSGGGHVNGVLTDLLTSIENVIAGDGGSTLNGDGQDNRFVGGAGDDLLFGNDGNDTFVGGGHVDGSFNQLWGGSGIDTADYSGETDKVFVDLRAPAGHIDTGSGFVLNDLMNSVENVLGGSNDDILVGTDTDNNVLSGGAGTDLLFGFGGNDTLIGGSANAGQYNQLWADTGSDTASYVGTTNRVYADLNVVAGWVDDGTGNLVLTDVYNSVENLTGGSAGDSLVGDTGANTLTGMTGADLLYANTGPAFDVSIDTFVFTSAADSNLTTGYDTITNFKTGQDKIDLTTFHITAAEITISSGGGSTSVYANTDGLPGDDLAFVLIGNNAAVAGDFLF